MHYYAENRHIIRTDIRTLNICAKSEELKPNLFVQKMP